MMVEQLKLAPGVSDKTRDCYYCSAYWPNGEAVFRCTYMDEIEVHKCGLCGHCNSFRAITDKDLDWLKEDFKDGRIEKVTFNRWRWVKP